MSHLLFAVLRHPRSVLSSPKRKGVVISREAGSAYQGKERCRRRHTCSSAFEGMTPMRPMLGHLHPEEMALEAAHTTSRACRFVQGSCNTDAALKRRDDVGELENDNTRRGNYTYTGIV